MLEPTAMLKTPFAATPNVPADRSVNCKVSSHSGVGVYEITLDQGVDALEAVILSSCEGVDATVTFTHTSDTVKVARTMLVGVLSDAVNFSFAIYRIPPGHP